jgi:hypothetical protein
MWLASGATPVHSYRTVQTMQPSNFLLSYLLRVKQTARGDLEPSHTKGKSRLYIVGVYMHDMTSKKAKIG